MAFNGSGVFNRLYSWANDAAANIKIRADRMDNEMNGMATGLSTCITKDGQTTITANLPMATYRHTGVGDGQSRTDYTSVGQTQDGKIHWVAAGGTADAITAAYTIPITALVDGQICYVRAGAANTTTTPTFSPSSLTARTIVKNGGQALVAGDIYGAGHELVLRYNLANTRWELLNPSVVVVAAVTDATISTSDVTTNNVSSTKHGWSPKSPADATQFLNGAATPAYAQVKDSDLSTTDITTNNASTSKHGFLKKLSNTVTDYMDGTGNWTSPIANGSVIGSSFTTYKTNAVLSTNMPIDDTIPQNTEGDQVFSVAYTCSKSTSKLRIRISVWGTRATSGVAVGTALFVDSGADAVAAAADSTQAASTLNAGFVISLAHELTPGDTSSHTYSVRVGANSGNISLNGNNAGRFFGGVGQCTMSIEEIKA